MVSGRSLKDSNVDRPGRHPDGSGQRPDGSGRLWAAPDGSGRLLVGPQLIGQILDTALFSPFWERIATTYDVHLGGAHWKGRSGLPISVNWTFPLVLRLRRYGQKTERKSSSSASGWVSIHQIFTQKGTSPPIIFAQIVRPMYALQLYRWQFSQRLFKRSAILHRKRPFCVFGPHLGNWGT